MNNPTKKDQHYPINSQVSVKYAELSDSELEVVCGGGNRLRRRSSSINSAGVKA